LSGQTSSCCAGIALSPLDKDPPLCYGKEQNVIEVKAMQIYTLKEASRKTKIPMETLKRACEEGLIRANKLANRQWRISESALEAALDEGLDMRGLVKRTGGKKKRPQPEALRRHQEQRRAQVAA
jgi:excisionase family DNA binding protein